jgi:MFS family permease
MSKWTSIAVLILCIVLSLSLWFAATAVVPALRGEIEISDTLAALFTSVVSIGFVCGTLASAILGLADRIPPKRFFMLSAFVAAVANGAIMLVEPDSNAVVVLRFITGACMAGIYPVGMKMASSWAIRDMGLLIGLVGAGITLGKSLPYLLNVIGDVNWRFTLLAASGMSIISGLLVNLVALGPALGRTPPFDIGAVLQAWKNKPLRLANLGYFGHMWELFAMWGWIGVFLSASLAQSGVTASDSTNIYANLATFAVIAVGGLGCLAGGLIADRYGRTTLTIGALAISGSCAAGAGFLFGGPTWLLILVCLVWGLTIVADSPQFSSCVIELSPPEYIGTMLTIQTCIGFLLTLTTIHLVPSMVEAVGWRYAFAPLVLGPLVGVIAMLRLRYSPDAYRLAGGRR